MSNNINDIPEKSNEDSKVERNIEDLNNNEDNIYNDFLRKIKASPVIANRLDYYPNSIPLGSFCFGVSFILFGFYECKIHKEKDNLLYIVILLFGGIGQLTAGIFEFIKARVYPATLYITYGLYCLSFYLGNIFNEKYPDQKFFGDENQKVFFGSWAFLGAPLIILSLRINIFFLIQNITIVAFFVIKCIGLCEDFAPLKGIVSGILESVAGVCSLYICYGQILNEHFQITLLPSIPLKKDNEIDDYAIKRE